MPKKDYKDPRLVAGMMKQIPKRNLRKMLEAHGKKADLMESIGRDRKQSGRVSDWISGKDAMSNEMLLRVAAALNVSPLYLLDLTDEQWPKSDIDPEPSDVREGLQAAIDAINASDWHALYKMLEYDVEQQGFNFEIRYRLVVGNMCINSPSMVTGHANPQHGTLNLRSIDDNSLFLVCPHEEKAVTETEGGLVVNRSYLEIQDQWNFLIALWLESREVWGVDFVLKAGPIIRELLLLYLPHLKGDYRDLRKLARDLADTSPITATRMLCVRPG